MTRSAERTLRGPFGRLRWVGTIAQSSREPLPSSMHTTLSVEVE